MRNMHYKAYAFRLDERTITHIRNLKAQLNKSYNLLFFAMLMAMEKELRRRAKKQRRTERIDDIKMIQTIEGEFDLTE